MTAIFPVLIGFFIPVITFIFLYKIINFWELNFARDYLENREEKHIKDLESKIKVIRLREKKNALIEELERLRSVSERNKNKL